jgi:hypothetical protein
MKGHAVVPVLISLLTSACLGQATKAEIQAENLAACSVIGSDSEPLTPYGFARAALISLWHARNGAARGNEIKKAGQESDNMFTFQTAMMRITKTSTNDFLCAKRTMRRFTGQESEENIRTASEFFMSVYNAHIVINDRTLDLL